MILGMITLDQYLMGREVRFPITDEYKDNALILLDKISELEHIFGETLTMTSGYRPSQINRQTPGASLTSTHETCEGIDLRDISGELGQFLITNVNILKALDLYMESPKSAKDHVHLQIRPPKSGRRIFLA